MHGFHALRGLHGQRRDGPDAIAVMRGDGLEVRCDARAGGWIETRDGQHVRRGHIHVIGQCFESLREKKSPTEKWTGCARTSREPASRNVRAWPPTRNRNFREYVVCEEQSGETRNKKRKNDPSQGNKPRTKVASATRPTAKIYAAARG